MDLKKYTFEDQVTTIEDYVDEYLKKKPPDCVLYSEDGTEFKIHNELLGQTDFLRKILSSAKNKCCEIIEILCPCSKEELRGLVKFLRTGGISCENKFDFLKIVKNLNKIFGFPESLIIDVKKRVEEKNLREFETVEQSDIDTITSPPLDKHLVTEDGIIKVHIF